MEPNNFERQLKQKLENSTIQPSGKAWDQLEAMLDTAYKVKDKRNYTWIYIAASFVGLLIISSVFFSQKEIEDIKTDVEVVVKESIVPKVIQKPTAILPQQINKGSATYTTNNNNNNFKSGAAVTNQNATIIKTPAILNQNPIVQVSIINQKLPLNSITSQNQTSTSEMLAVLENASPKEKQLNSKQVVHVDAANLLSQVDGELELSFREKVINKVSKNYQAVKVAFANRNFE